MRLPSKLLKFFEIGGPYNRSPNFVLIDFFTYDMCVIKISCMQNFITLTKLLKNLKMYRKHASNIWKFYKLKMSENCFFYMACYSSKEIGCKKIANFAGYFLRNGKKDYFFLPKIFELLPAKLNFSRIPKDFQIYHMV